MALLKFKFGVNVRKTTIIAAAVINAANALGITKDITVTSGNDSQHKDNSKHYSEEALDFRTKNLTVGEKGLLVVAVRKRLGPDYDVILEAVGKANEHLHIEYDPA